MADQTVFKRYELKYMITPEQKQRLLAVMDPIMELDQYGRTTIRNIYFDTDNYRLIRRSMEKPAYKEKLRIRSYRKASAKSKVFVELKKKYNHVVYKRRLALTREEAMDWVTGKARCTEETQIAREISYALGYYKDLRPVMFLSYEREAYRCRDGGDFRVTFDDHILARQEDISLESEAYGTSLLEEGKVLMELKCSGGIPLWMVKFLSEERIYKTAFSKYGTAYRILVFPNMKKGDISYA